MPLGEPKRIVQIAAFGYQYGESGYDGLVVLTDDGELYERSLSETFRTWRRLRPPTPGVNIDGTICEDEDPESFDLPN